MDTLRGLIRGLGLKYRSEPDTASGHHDLRRLASPGRARTSSPIDFYELYKDHRDKFEIVALHDSSVPDFAEMDKKLEALFTPRTSAGPIIISITSIIRY